jgi:hypothetical protein
VKKTTFYWEGRCEMESGERIKYILRGVSWNISCLKVSPRQCPLVAPVKAADWWEGKALGSRGGGALGTEAVLSYEHRTDAEQGLYSVWSAAREARSATWNRDHVS